MSGWSGYFAMAIFVAPARSAAQQGAVSPVHEGERLVDQALGAPALGRGLPFIAVADGHGGIDMAAGDLMGRDPCSLAVENGIENVEQHAETPTLERRRREAGRQAYRRGARQTPIEPVRCRVTQIDRIVAHDHIGKRAVFQGIADPEPVRPIDVAEDDMTAGREPAVGKDDRPGVEIERCGLGKAGGRRVEDDRRGRERGQPVRGFSRSEDGRRARESTAPSAGPSPPGPRRSLPSSA